MSIESIGTMELQMILEYIPSMTPTYPFVICIYICKGERKNEAYNELNDLTWARHQKQAYNHGESEERLLRATTTQIIGTNVREKLGQCDKYRLQGKLSTLRCIADPKYLIG